MAPSTAISFAISPAVAEDTPAIPSINSSKAAPVGLLYAAPNAAPTTGIGIAA